ncbi:MAG: toll/interleukin-1 receptor domain-containing protein [Burkholderiales bacterium]|nr:toll/interleukin-1 receptor domain-containing protein [Burkholderiales bacterium]
MSTVFLSYAQADHFFAELLATKLQLEGLTLWRDQVSIRAGDDWRRSIEDGIKQSLAVVVALSAHSAESPYVTYEWAYALGMGKTVVPVRLSACRIHPRLEITQHIDFSYPRSLPWSELIDRLRNIETESELRPRAAVSAAGDAPRSTSIDETARAVLAYLNSQGYTMASFDRLRQKIDPPPTDVQFEAVIAARPDVFRHARIKGGKPGIAKRVP